ncbi:MAG: endo-1,4-beta-xylanase [Anaerolineae bacterium]|nr:endo-1,4-beta-xylanase [Anaerolineae bacterium]
MLNPPPPATPAPQPTVTPVPSTPTPSPVPTATRTPSPTLAPGVSLRTLAEAQNVYIGAAVAAGPLQDEPIYGETLAREFNMLTAENVMKFESVHPDPKTYSFSAADALVDFAEEHAMQVRGHTLVWHNQLPPWVIEKKWERDELSKVLEDHISTVVGRYRGRVVAWDVVNEAIDDNGSLRQTVWLEGIGPDYIELAFQAAHEADPEALLFYNDYNGEGLGRKSDAIYELVQDLVQRGVPIHGVGLQMHVSVGRHPLPEKVAANIQRLSALGLKVHITEMDVRIESPTTETDLARQAQIYGEMLHVCLAAPSCEAFVLWGFTDRYSWIPDVFYGWNDALIFDPSYQPKPAYYALLGELAEK